MVVSEMTYGVMVRDADGQTRFETMLATSPDRAADMVAQGNPGWQPVAVTARYEVAGRCSRCKLWVFTPDAVARPDGTAVCCRDCAGAGEW